MRVMAIDPGHTQSAFVVLDESGRVERHDMWRNEDLAHSLRCGVSAKEEFRLDLPENCAMEMVASYGMAVGREVFETVLWIGRFVEILQEVRGRGWGRCLDLVYRRDVKLTLCGQSRAKDANVRQALLDMYGGSRETAIGKKKTPGPLYGLSGDGWAALGVAVTWMRARCGETWAPREFQQETFVA